MTHPLDSAPIRWLEETGSTNDDARELALAGKPGPLWIAARRQHAGRGRQGRAWRSLDGNLHATLLWRPGGPMAGFSGLSFVAALAVLRMAGAFLPPGAEKDLALKWPNDLLLAGNKIAGLLLEADQDETHGDWLALGIGVNLAHAPDHALFPASALAAHMKAHPPAPEAALPVLAARLAELAALWQTPGGAAKIHRLWLARAWAVGKQIRVRLADEIIEGIFAGLDESGALKLSGPQGMRHIHAGDVFFPDSIK